VELKNIEKKAKEAVDVISRLTYFLANFEFLGWY
jgi:hypothetical protein